MMKKIILIAILTLILIEGNTQVSIDSIINLSLIQHRKGFEFQQKKYSSDRIFYIKNRTLNDEIEIEVDENTVFLLESVESSAFEKWGRKMIGPRGLWSGSGTENALIRSGFLSLSRTRAGKNLINLTADMAYDTGSNAWRFWGRLSQQYVNGIPKGSNVKVFVTRSNLKNLDSIYNTFEKPILIQRGIKFQEKIID